MGTRSLIAAIVVVGFAHSAYADPKAKVSAKAKEAMESYDLMDYDAAKKLLNQALDEAKKAKLEKDPVTAKVYLDIGISAFAAGDQDGAKAAFASAAQIDPKITIEAAYKSPELVKMLDEAKAAALGGGAPIGSEPAEPSADCKSVKGLQHTIIDTAKQNTPQPIEALLGSDVKPAKVSLMYRSEGATDFSEVKLTAQGCKYTGSIPAAAMKGSVIHYYVAAFNENNKVIVGKGSAGAPNIVELTAGPAGGPAKGDDEDPINGKKGSSSSSSSSSGGSVSSSSSSSDTGPRKRPRVMLAVAGGTGFGYASVNGKTEGENMVRSGGFANSFVVITPELGYYATPQITIGIAARLGLPLGASVPDHATLAPGALVRVRYAFDPSGEGVRLLGQAGVGILRNTIKLDGQMGMAGETDIVAQGPLLLGAGVGYTKRLSGNIAFLADFAAIAGIAVVDHLGSAPHLNTGISADLNLGLALGF